jgi:hypothetical protein
VFSFPLVRFDYWPLFGEGIRSVVTKRGRDEIKSTGNGKVPKKLMPDPVNGETVAQSMVRAKVVIPM